MQIRETSIAGLVELTPRVFNDERGMFFESYNEQIFKQLGLPTGKPSAYLYVDIILRISKVDFKR